MISAHELGEITKLSDANVDAALERLEPRLKDAAEYGKRVYVWQDQETSKTERVYGYSSPHLFKSTAYQDRLITKLKALGYQAVWKATGEPKPPCGHLGGGIDEDRKDELYQTYAIHIGW